MTKAPVGIKIGPNNYKGLADCEGKEGELLGSQQVQDTTYGGRPCRPMGYTTHYSVRCGDIYGTLFEGQFIVIHETTKK